MNYEETLQYLYDRLPMFQRIGAAAYKANLDNTLRLVDFLGNPQKKLRFIHIAGTNGKGSVSHMLAAILQSQGLRTGLFTSPHLKDFRERIKVDGKMVPRSWVTWFVQYFKKDFEQLQPSFFEMSFGMAMRYFKEQNCDIVVLETGMGGRLDSTNIVHPVVSVITNISFDHREFLGDSLEMIAAEKAGIIKEHIPVVIGRHHPDTDEIFSYKAELEESRITYAQDVFEVVQAGMAGSVRGKLMLDIHRMGRPYLRELKCPLTGSYQKENILTVLAAVEELIAAGYDIRKNHIIKGINDVIKLTGLMGRYQILGSNPLRICDTAHNPDGLKMVMEQLKGETYRKLHFVLGVVSDKDLKGILKLFPQDAVYYFCKANIPRGLDAGILRDQAAGYGLRGNVYASVNEAYKAACSAAGADDLVFTGGSTFTVAEVL
ncbi:MAG TPA: folylpolyglutamate synthase/dihydrofolate synthase family protein [Bacteroidales bacterium]|nr:folylpolyglutamate synthase/dihydrofolate synthase family protein [Bacteroidales bacterium]